MPRPFGKIVAQIETMLLAGLALVLPVFLSAMMLNTGETGHGKVPTRLDTFLNSPHPFGSLAFALPFVSPDRIDIAIRRPIIVSALPEVTLESGRLVVPREGSGTSDTDQDLSKKPDGKISVEEVILKNPKITIRLPRGSTLQNDKLGLPTVFGPLAAALKNFEFSRLRIENGSLEVHYPKRLPEKMQAVFATLVIDDDRSAVAKGQLTYNKEPLTFEISLKKAERKDEAVLVPISGRINSGLITSSFNGSLVLADEISANGTMDLVAVDLARALKWMARSDLSVESIGKFSAKGPVVWRNGTLEFSKASFALDGNEATGSLALNFSKRTPSIDGTLALTRLDLTQYLVGFLRRRQTATAIFNSIMQADGTSQQSANELSKRALAGDISTVDILNSALKKLTKLSPADASAPSAGVRRQRVSKFELPVLQQFDADLRMSVRETSIANLTTGPSAMTIALRSGRLLADIAEMQVHGGTISGQFELESRLFLDPHIAIRATIKNVDSGAFLGAFLKKSPVEGKMSIALDVQSNGSNVKNILSRMSGDASMSVPAGGTAGVDIIRLMEDARKSSRTGWGDAAIQGQTNFDELKARVEIKNGKLRTQRAELRLGRRILVAKGFAHLADEELGMRLRIGNPEPAVEPDQPVKLAPNAQSVTLKGSWHEPKIAHEPPQPSAQPN